MGGALPRSVCTAAIRPLRRRPVRLATAVATAAVVAFAACAVAEEQEISLGADAANEINSQLPLVTDAYIAGYVQRLGQEIADRTERRDLTWHFHVVDSPQINAFALPGGYVYVNRGLIEATQSVSELAGVLGHEIGHIVQRHSIEQMQKHAGAGVGIAVLCSVTNACESEVGRAALQIGGSFVLARYSRRDELEADSEAVVNVIRAGSTRSECRDCSSAFSRRATRRAGPPPSSRTGSRPTPWRSRESMRPWLSSPYHSRRA
jgi:beta-barrel assembly-enhancing protease